MTNTTVPAEVDALIDLISSTDGGKQELRDLYNFDKKTVSDIFQFDVNGNLNAVLSKENSSVNVFDKSEVIPLVFSGSGDSVEIPTGSYNSISLNIIGSVTITVKGCAISGSTAYQCYDGATAMSSAITTGGTVFWRGIPGFIKISANGACTVNAQLMNV